MNTGILIDQIFCLTLLPEESCSEISSTLLSIKTAVAATESLFFSMDAGSKKHSKIAPTDPTAVKSNAK